MTFQGTDQPIHLSDTTRRTPLRDAVRHLLWPLRAAVVVPVLAVALTTGGMATAADAGVEARPPVAGAFKTITANIGSGTECGGYTPDPSTSEPCLDALKGAINGYDPDVVVGQEFCLSDYEALKTFLLAKDPTWEVYFTPTFFHKWPLMFNTSPKDPTNGHGCPDGHGGYQAKGQVLAGKSLDVAVEYVLAPPVGDVDDPWAGQAKQYTMLCARVIAGTEAPSRACVVHLATRTSPEDAALHAKELLAIQNVQEKWGGRPLIAGDFNNRAPGLARMSPLDRSTIDHITYRRKNGMDSGVGSPVDQSFSDHDIRVSWVKYS